MLPAIQTYSEIGTKFFIEFCKLKDEICQFIKNPESKSPFWNKRHVLDSYRSQNARFKGFLGFALDVLLISNPKLDLPAHFPDLRTWWLLEPQYRSSTIFEVARSLLSSHETRAPPWALWLPHTDHHTKAALGHAMIESDRLPKDEPEICASRYLLAKLLLDDALMAIESQYLPSSLEFGLASAALVSCCTVVKNYVEGRSFAREAFKLRGEELSSRHDTVCLRHALAILYIDEPNSGEDQILGMKQAKKIFEDLLKISSLSAYFVVLVTLDLNRLRRELYDPDAYALDESSILWSALGHLTLVCYDLQVRFLKELCDISDKQLCGGFLHLQKRRPILKATKEKLNHNHLLQKDGSLATLEKRCTAFESFSSLFNRDTPSTRWARSQ